MTTLAPALRKKLEDTVIRAREIAETGALTALRGLAVHAPEHFPYLSADERALRRRLRALAHQIGDSRDAQGGHGIDRLVSECAYEHWQRMLFARFLAENGTLIANSETLGLSNTPVSLDECHELAEEDGARNGWDLAARYASRMLPQIFRADSPIFELKLPPELQQELEKLLAELPTDVFTATDSLGWVYQFWQTKEKERINSAGVKIGPDELPAVTQLFTEPYMVSFQLDNALGAWWAARRLTNEDLANAEDEEELRRKASIPGVPLDYLRFVRNDDHRWTPAAGIFEHWPTQLSEFKVIDPTCGSGHFLVATLLMLAPMRMELEGLSARDAVDAVLRENLHGLDIDKRVTEIAAFALALAAWVFPNAGGYRPLPELHVACSGLPVGRSKEEWRALGLGGKNLKIAMDWMYDVFKDAPTLGSLIDPLRTDAAKLVQPAQLAAALNNALAQDLPVEQREATIVAQGIAKSAALLQQRYHWVVTNVPYLAGGKQDDVLRTFSQKNYADAKSDLATTFLDRCLELTTENGTASIVLPQNWLFLGSYKKFRERLLRTNTWNLLVRLGPGAFETISGEIVQAALIAISRGTPAANDGELFGAPSSTHHLRGLDVSEGRKAADKATMLKEAEVFSVEQARQLENPDARIVFEETSAISLLAAYAESLVGLQTGDDPMFITYFWEVDFQENSIWEPMQDAPSSTALFTGFARVVRWERGTGLLLTTPSARPTQGLKAIGQQGITLHRMGSIVPYIYSKERFHQNVATLVPHNPAHLPAIWCYCSSPDYNEAVRRIDQKLNVTNATLVKVPFDLPYWTSVAEERYPNGLPQPYTDDPTQWIFHGHPCGSVVWDEVEKWTAPGAQRVDKSVLQVAVARLLGYQWPAELDPEMELAAEQRALVVRCQELQDFADNDGIVCLPSVRGEAPADQRLSELLAAAYGDAWTPQVRDALLNSIGTKGKGLDWWLQEQFFKEHCETFQQRPFIWHIWDGLKRGGFSALVNYHRLDRKLLETLTYTYLGDWIRRQQDDLARKVDGADERLEAARQLQARLELILDGEAPYDIFVRWKALHEQPIGWEPDLNDGVRMNIRPFMSVPDVGVKDAGILRSKPNIHWKKDRGTDIPSAPWYDLGPSYGGKEGDRINDHHLSLAEKREGRGEHGDQG